MDPKQSAADGGLQSTTGTEPDATGGDGGAPNGTPARPPQRTATGPDQDTIDKLIARGAKVARRDLNETVAKKYGKGLDDVLADYDERIAKEAESTAKVEGEKEKHQRELERRDKQHAQTTEKLTTLQNRLKTSELDGRVKDVLAKMTPANEAAVRLLQREARDRIKVEIDDKGELEVTFLDAKGKPADDLDAAGLAAELSEALPMLVTQRTGHGSGLGVTVTTSEKEKLTKQPTQGGSVNGNGDPKTLVVGGRSVPVFSPQDNIDALGRMVGGQEK